MPEINNDLNNKIINIKFSSSEKNENRKEGKEILSETSLDSDPKAVQGRSIVHKIMPVSRDEIEDFKNNEELYEFETDIFDDLLNKGYPYTTAMSITDGIIAGFKNAFCENSEDLA